MLLIFCHFAKNLRKNKFHVTILYISCISIQIDKQVRAVDEK